jgi:hypothetical protein
MARSRRAWTTLLAEIRSLLRETTATGSFWSDAQLLIYFNACIDLRVMQLAILDEGWVTDQVYTDLVADQREYPLPEGAGRVKKVSLTYTLGSQNYEIELRRDDRWGKNTVHGVGSASITGYQPTYQLQANLILLEPKPRFALASALQIDLESAPARLTTGTDKIDLRFPDVLETLLVFDTVLVALASENNAGSTAQDYVVQYREFQQRFEAVFLEYATDRTEGLVVGQPFRQGA